MRARVGVAEHVPIRVGDQPGERRQSLGDPLPYLAMAGETARPPGVFCDSGFSCSVGDHISFDNNGNPLTKFDNPGQIFDQLFMGLTPGMTNTQAAAGTARVQIPSIAISLTAVSHPVSAARRR